MRLFLTFLLFPLFANPIFLYAQQTNSQAPQAVQTDSSEIQDRGYISFQVQVDSFFVVIDDNFDDVHHISINDSLTVTAGPHQFRLIKKYYKDTIRNTTIKKDQSTLYVTSLIPISKAKTQKQQSSYPYLYWNANMVIQTDPDAKIFVGDKYLGQQTVTLDSTGIFDVVSKHPSGRTLTHHVNTTMWEQPFNVIRLYHRPEKRKSRYLAFLPGASQLYQREKIKGYALIAGTVIGSGATFMFHRTFSDKNQKFVSTHERYLAATDPKAAFELGNLAEKQYDAAKRAANLRDAFLFGTIGLYLYNVIDAFIKPEPGYRKTIELDPYIDFNPNRNHQLGIQARYNF